MVCCTPKDLLLWPHNLRRRVRAGKVCDTGGKCMGNDGLEDKRDSRVRAR